MNAGKLARIAAKGCVYGTCFGAAGFVNKQIVKKIAEDIDVFDEDDLKSLWAEYFESMCFCAVTGYLFGTIGYFICRDMKL